jgi:PiT family inorganic phosphate transporter
MLILIGILPAHYALDPRHKPSEVNRIIAATDEAQELVEHYIPVEDRLKRFTEVDDIRKRLEDKAELREVPSGERLKLRNELIQVDNFLKGIEKMRGLEIPAADRAKLARTREEFRSAVYYAPDWVLIAVALALGGGTMVGWKRIVVTVGEKIGKSHLTYAQGASAELVAMTTIGLADFGGLPVSTTQVLSSGVAGTMAANGTGLQWSTVRNIAIAWVLTLPVCMVLSAILYLLFRMLAG